MKSFNEWWDSTHLSSTRIDACREAWEACEELYEAELTRVTRQLEEARETNRKLNRRCQDLQELYRMKPPLC